MVLADKTLAGAALPHLDEFMQLCLAAQVPCESTTDIWKLKWTKLVFNSALNAWTTLRSTTLDQLLKDPETRPAFVATMQETVAVAEASGVKLDNDVTEKTLALAGSLGAVYSSMYGDRQMGKRLEVDALNGFIMRKGRELGVPTPYNEKLYNELSALNS
jgi:2-dehydropantoate 2-reductase